MAKVLLITGGAWHPFDQCGQILADLFKNTGRADVTVTSDRKVLGSPDLKNYDHVVMYTQGGKLTAKEEQGITSFVKGGKGFLGIHCAADSFVENFIGGNRTMKWLQMVRVSEVMLPYRDLPSLSAALTSANLQAFEDPIDETSTLADVVIRLVTTEENFLPVVGLERRPVGIVTADCIEREIRKCQGLPSRERRSDSAGTGV